MPYPKQHKQVVKLLLARGANVQVTALDGRTVLHNTARTGDADLVRSMVENGADIRRRNGFAFSLRLIKSI
jgi:ankyrin repeat protein